MTCTNNESEIFLIELVQDSHRFCFNSNISNLGKIKKLEYFETWNFRILKYQVLHLNLLSYVLFPHSSTFPNLVLYQMTTFFAFDFFKVNRKKVIKLQEFSRNEWGRKKSNIHDFSYSRFIASDENYTVELVLQALVLEKYIISPFHAQLSPIQLNS
ncbi:hypothetical protein AX774_g6353 [Zancudomyces culisetae]|uniref:Uncharacterized protein n=1 Tax=Zancudomyces culisetae TaxID=1213189 RepID=A0A1R1PGT8_ZANCU|nr:hypothetical protein AX774_g6353 [Zancudomyces culisetae]|eukprot:OMH80215.1 hypothetical protein AX774_g6353 [Zancudomyces culisetae]